MVRVCFDYRQATMFVVAAGVCLLLFAGFASSNGIANDTKASRVRRETQALYLTSGVLLAIAACMHIQARTADYSSWIPFLMLAGGCLYPFAHYAEASNPVAPDVSALSEEDAAVALAAHVVAIQDRERWEGVMQAVGGGLVGVAALVASSQQVSVSTASQ